MVIKVKNKASVTTDIKILLTWELAFFLFLTSLIACNKPAEPEFTNPFDEQSDEFIESPGLSTIEVSNIDVPTAISGGQFTNDYGYEITSKGVCWSTQVSPTINDICSDEGGGKEDFTSSLTGIEYNSVYYVRAYAKNEAGFIYGEQKQFETKVLYDLSINIIGQGTVEETVANQASKTEYAIETVVELKAVPEDNWRFDHWENDLAGDNNPEQVIIDDNKEVDAVFIELLKWKFQTGNAVSSSPAISSDGTIYVGSWDNNLYAINSNGSLKWRYQTDEAVVSSPAISSAGTIYVGSYDDYLYAINSDGTLKWKYHAAKTLKSSPAIALDGTIYIGSYAGDFFAINPDKTIKWKFQANDAIESSPAIAPSGTIYVGSWDNNFYAINPNGSLKWKYQTGDRIKSSPAIATDGTIYIGSTDNSLYAINPNGSLKWKFQTNDNIISSPVISTSGVIYVGSNDNYLYAINPDGSLKWKFQTNDNVRGSPAVASDGTIYCGSFDTFIYAINPDGSLKWRLRTDGRVFSNPVIDLNGIIYIGGDDHSLYAIFGKTSGPSESSWPIFGQNIRRTSRIE